MSYSIDPALSRLIKQRFPAERSAGSFFPLHGLTGLTAKVELERATLLARHQRQDNPVPGVDRQREYRILRKLSGCHLAPAACGYADNWLLLGWQPGEALSEEAFPGALDAVIGELARLHQQPLSGYPLQLQKLLERYWQLSRPARRHYGWLRALQRLQRRGEPKPLRRALLHMDVHPGNLIRQQNSLRLIDWEYASDGDVALELAALVAGNALDAEQQRALTERYAALQRLDAARLRQQMARWQPWLTLLAASWYELRWQQSGEQTFYTLAAQAWQRVRS